MPKESYACQKTNTHFKNTDFKRALYTKKDLYTLFTHVKKVLRTSKEQYTSQKNPIHKKKSSTPLRKRKESHTFQENPTHVKRPLHQSKEPYPSQKSPT